MQHLAGLVESHRSRRGADARAYNEAALRLDPGHEGARDGLARLDFGSGVETASSLLAAASDEPGAMDLLRATWHRVVWLLCLGPFVVSHISRILLQSRLDDPRTAAEVNPVVLILLAPLVPATAAWA